MQVRARTLASKRLLALRGDAALVARVRADETAAFEVLYERHLPAILSFCRHMLGSPDEAEDAVQQVFLSAHRQLVADGRAINLKPWLYAIARNRCLSMLRARREEVSDEVSVSTRGLDEVVQERADLRSLLADLGDLPDEQRAALVLTELGDLSHAEVGQVLGCGEARVKGFVFRARSGLMERREAREASCADIRVELAGARAGGLRRGRLKHHLKACPECASFMAGLRSQRRMMGLILPVAPSMGLKPSILGALAGGGVGGGAALGGGAMAAGGAGATAAGLSATGSAASFAALSVAKLAAIGVVAAGTGVAVVATDATRSDPPPPAPSAKAAPQSQEPVRAPRRAGAGAAPAAGGISPRAAGRVKAGAPRPAGPAKERGRRAAGRRVGRRGGGQAPSGRADAPGRPRRATGRPATPPGQAKPRPAGRPAAPPGQSRPRPAPKARTSPAAGPSPQRVAERETRRALKRAPAGSPTPRGKPAE